jgi:hypothetical protein
MRRALPWLALGLVLTTAGAANPAPYTLEGTVRDRQLRAPVAGATVSLLPSMRSTTTEDDGSFSFGPLQIVGEGQLVISHPEYRTVTLPLGSLGTDAWHLDVTIMQAAEALPGAPDQDDAR